MVYHILYMVPLTTPGGASLYCLSYNIYGSSHYDGGRVFILPFHIIYMVPLTTAGRDLSYNLYVAFSHINHSLRRGRVFIPFGPFIQKYLKNDSKKFFWKNEKGHF
jgi:hypothetical protein